MKVVAGIDSMFYHFWYLALLLLTSCLFFLSQIYAPAYSSDNIKIYLRIFLL